MFDWNLNTQALVSRHWLRLHGNLTIIKILLLHWRLIARMQSWVRNRLITNVTIITEATVTLRYCYMKNSNVR